MRVGVVHTVGSPCRCAEAVSIGLESLNYELCLVDSADIEMQAPALAGECDLVIDHTDTYCGRGLYRPFVRLLLENWGARVVGSSAEACFVADNKAAAKQCLADAGIPVPPGIVIRSNDWTLPGWLHPPLILKPAFEHMSRGVSIARTEQDAYAAAAQILDSLRQPVLVESYIHGRELAVSLISGPEGIEVLPILEWRIDSAAILTEDFKLMDASEGRHPTLRADLSGELKNDLEELARRAFFALGLQDYARFDVRLSQDGSVFFLEANTTPSLEPLEALAVSAQWAGFNYPALVGRLLAAAHSRFERMRGKQTRIVQVPLPTGPVELEIPRGVHAPSPSTVELADLLDIREGDEALELGCGSGLLSITMAKRGAKRVIATDLDSRALQAATDNARRNGVEQRIEFRAGSWYEALDRSLWGPGQRAFDVIVATPPQTPGAHPFGPKYGGWEGTKHLLKILQGAPDFLEPERGRLWLLAISLANPGELWKELRARFYEVELIRETERPFTAGEYEELESGLFDYLVSLRASGISEFKSAESGRGSFRNLFISRIEASKKMKHLIVNADDVGADEARNAGIFEAIGAGVVTSVSILANGPALDDALRRIRQLPRNSISLGIHCNLSEGTPLASGLENLTGPDGRFPGKKSTQKLLTGPAYPELQQEILRELNAQIIALRDSGIHPDHLDGHQHVHIFPAAIDPVVKAAQTHNIAWIRVPHEPQEFSLYPVFPADREEAHFFSRHAEQARPVFNAAGLLTTSHFRGLYFKGRLPSSNWVEFLNSMPHELTELMVHPGRCAGTTSGPFSSFSTQAREMELQALIDGRFRTSLLETGVKLTRFPATRLGHP